MTFRERLGIQAAAQRAIVAARYDVAISRAFLARSRASATDPVQHTYGIGDQVFYWRGLNVAKKDWRYRWHGPAVII
eukprot:2356558-Lingulodinium_polyedra.AAC.1